MRQKAAEFYFVSYPAADLLRKVHFVTRFYGDRGEEVGGDRSRKPDEIEQFIGAVEGGEKAFQRALNRTKVRQIRDFFRNEVQQPVIPGAVLLYTSEELPFRRMSGADERVGHLSEPQGKFLIIDGQHRLAGLHFYRGESDADPHIEVPCVIFDGKTADFATEMFVIINSTHTRINKSHLIDLYERIEWGTDLEKKYTSGLVRALYESDDSPLQYHINMLGGRSQQDMWLNQAQLFSEIYRLIRRKDARYAFRDGRGWSRARGYGFLRDVFRGARNAFREAWGDNKRYMVTRDVTLKALLRLSGDLAETRGDLDLDGDSSAALKECFAPWVKLVAEFRREGFYERFPAKGQVERVEKIRKRLAREAGI
jgi:DGQHR domain-containing protein